MPPKSAKLLDEPKPLPVVIPDPVVIPEPEPVVDSDPGADAVVEPEMEAVEVEIEPVSADAAPAAEEPAAVEVAVEPVPVAEEPAPEAIPETWGELIRRVGERTGNEIFVPGVCCPSDVKSVDMLEREGFVLVRQGASGAIFRRF